MYSFVYICLVLIPWIYSYISVQLLRKHKLSPDPSYTITGLKVDFYAMQLMGVLELVKSPRRLQPQIKSVLDFATSLGS